MIDLRSDTLTRPTSAMRKFMCRAEVGDDVYGEDRTTHELEAVSAELTGKEAACFFPSGTMANLTAILTLCARGKELLVGEESDLYNFEAGGVSVIGGIVMHPVRTEITGELSLENLQRAIRDVNDPECAQAGVIALETPNVREGGIPLSVDYLSQLANFAHNKQLPVHIDGARLFNAAIALGVPAKSIAAFGDTIQFCLSKGLGCPVGSILSGSKEHMVVAKRWRKLLGGGMRQSGILAAAGLFALQHHLNRLAEDHELAKRFAVGLMSIDELDINAKNVLTNIVVFRLRDPDADQGSFLRDLQAYGVKLSQVGQGRIRAVTHLHHDTGQIDDAVSCIKSYFRDRKKFAL